jgi:uncharacterized protein involved in tolerance to divalent cations
MSKFEHNGSVIMNVAPYCVPLITKLLISYSEAEGMFMSWVSAYLGT